MCWTQWGFGCFTWSPNCFHSSVIMWLAFITEFLGSACERSGPHRGYTHLPTRGKLKALPKTNGKKQSGLLYALIWELLQTQRKFNNVWSHLVHWEGEYYHSIGWGRGWKCYFDNHSSLRRCLCRLFFFRYFSLKNNDDDDDDDDDNARFPKLKW